MQRVWTATRTEQGSREDVAEEVEDVVTAVAKQISQRRTVRLSVPNDAKLLFSSNRTRPSLAALLRVLDGVHGLALSNQTSTLRSMYYRAPNAYGRSQARSDAAIERAAKLLHRPRHALGISAAPRGFVAGPLCVRVGKEEESVVDCSAPALRHGGGWSIVGDFSTAVSMMTTTARLVVVVEKQTEHQRLCLNDVGFWQCSPDTLIVTGRGYPDEATCALVRALCSSEAEGGLAIPSAFVGDCDPFGADILRCYHRAGCFAQAQPPPWIALRSEDAVIGALPRSALAPLSSRDKSKAQQLLSLREQLPPGIAEQVEAMLATGTKAELDAAPPDLVPDAIFQVRGAFRQ